MRDKQTDKRTDRMTDNPNPIYIPPFFSKRGYNTTKLDLVNINAYIKFSENMSSCSQDILRKRNFGINQGP